MTIGPDGTRLWATDGWREVRRIDPGGYAFSPDSRLLALGDTFGMIRLTETATGTEVTRLIPPEPMRYSPAAFTPDGTRLIAACSGGTALYVFDLAAIRRGLEDLGLDWEWPALGPPTAAGPFRFVVNAGDLAESAPDPARLAAETAERYRQAIDRFRRELAADPENPYRSNNLAWAYLMAPPPLRDVRAALPLAEKAARLGPASAVFRNTLGLALYRAGRYRRAIALLRPNVEIQPDVALAYDLLFLAMSHGQLGEAAQARAYYDLAVRWTRVLASTPVAWYVEELALVRAEAADLLGIEVKPE